MLYAILYNGNDEMIAAAPACFQQPEGNRYWADIYPQTIELRDDCQTAYISIDDPQLISDLETLQTSDDLLSHCQRQVEKLTLPSHKQSLHPKAA